MFRQHVSAQFEAELATHLEQLAAHVSVDQAGLAGMAAELTDPRLGRPYSGLYWQVDRVGAGGTPIRAGLLRSRSLWDQVLVVPGDDPDDGQAHRHRVPGPEGTMLRMLERIVTIDAPGGGEGVRLRLIIAADEDLMVAPAERLDGALWLSLATLGLGLGLAVVVQVVVGLAPLERLRGALGAVRSGRTERLEGGFPFEVQPLVEEFNAVLAQNTEVVARARTQAGNLAHALKTPLSVLGNAASQRDDDFARLVSEQVETARRQVDYHLTRARAAGARVAGTRTALAPVLEGLVRVMRRVHADRAIEVVVRAPATPVVFLGDEQDLQEMLGNLLDNACKWAASRVEIGIASCDGRLAIDVDDDGGGIDPARREAMLGRGARADEKGRGSGLGLAIVDELARSYGGGVRLSESALGGLRATLEVPGRGRDEV
ncbi:MAG: sensor histidine kinase [Burkholderiaceae bacterium]|nr:sensor histidine kinase [Burkholderiaceae bacterium]